MAYVTNEDIERRLGAQTYVQLTDDDGDGNANEDVVNEARAGAEAEVNSYLAQRYAVPIDLDAHPELAPLLLSIVLDLVEFRLRTRRPPMAAEFLALHQRALKWLQDVSAGRIRAPSASGMAPNATEGDSARAIGEERRLTLDELESF